jgi:arginine decarboxylase
VLPQSNTSNTRRDMTHLIHVLAEICYGIDRRLEVGGLGERQALRRG